MIFIIVFSSKLNMSKILDNNDFKRWLKEKELIPRILISELSV